MDNAGATSIDSSWTTIEPRTFRFERPWRSPWSRKSAYTWASQKTSRVARVAARMSAGDLPPAAVAAITAAATIVP
jgi:hypothetical protein